MEHNRKESLGIHCPIFGGKKQGQRYMRHRACKVSALLSEVQERNAGRYCTVENGAEQVSRTQKVQSQDPAPPRILNELIDHIEVQQAAKIDGIWEQHLMIHYNCMGAIFIPDVFPLPAPQVSVNTRKGAVVNYAPNQLAV